MEDNRRIFGHMPDGTPVEEITLRGKSILGEDMTCKIITYGGAVRSLEVPDVKGNPVDVVLGFDTLEDYMAQDKYMGAIVGRYANRIGGAKFTLNGVEYRLAANEGPNHLHGGNVGFDKRVWTVEGLGEHYVSLSLVSPDGEEGYPGTLKTEVTYMLRGGDLVIDYSHSSDKDTICNVTNHSYFNLSGHDSGSVEDQHILLYADYYTPVGPGSIPTGEVAPVEGTPMDLREDIDICRVGTPIGARIGDGFEQLVLAGGYDHNWVLNPTHGGLRSPNSLAAHAWSPRTGIRMTVSSNMPGVQFYTGNFLDGCPRGKGGAVYGNRHGFCLETQHFPDSPNRPEFSPWPPGASCPGLVSCVVDGSGKRGFNRSTTFSFSICEPEEVLEHFHDRWVLRPIVPPIWQRKKEYDD